jgi:hypothetical protein
MESTLLAVCGASIAVNAYFLRNLVSKLNGLCVRVRKIEIELVSVKTIVSGQVSGLEDAN